MSTIRTPLERIERTRASLRILNLLLEKDRYYSQFIRKKQNPLGVASPNAVISSLEILRELGLIEEYISHVGITKVTQINYTLTEKGKDVARLVLKIQERLEAE